MARYRAEMLLGLLLRRRRSCARLSPRDEHQRCVVRSGFCRYSNCARFFSEKIEFISDDLFDLTKEIVASVDKSIQNVAPLSDPFVSIVFRRHRWNEGTTRTERIMIVNEDTDDVTSRNERVQRNVVCCRQDPIQRVRMRMRWCIPTSLCVGIISS